MRPGTSWVIARGFLRRLRGVGMLSVDQVLLIPHCRAVHTFGVRRPISLAFIDESFRVVRVISRLAPWRVAACKEAWGVVESFDVLDLSIGQVLPLCAELDRRAPKGSALVETALAIPILLFVLFVVMQIGILWHSKFALSHAALVSARHASLHHGSDTAIRDGLVVGLLPLSGKASDIKDLPTGLFRSGAEVTMGLSMGWIRWEVLSPTRQSFSDWGRPADRFLSPGSSVGDIEIPSESLSTVAQRRQPNSGVLKQMEGLPVGRVSGQTLIDANNLKVYFQVGIPLRLPVVGKLIAKTLGLFQGCGWSLSSGADRVGLVNFGSGRTPNALSPTIECRALAARDLSGEWLPRWPISVAAVIPMQSNARQSLMMLRDRKDYPAPK